MKDEIKLNNKIINLPKELINQIKKAIKKDREFPQENDRYFLIYSNGVITNTIYVEKDKEDKINKETGNYYRTEEEAQKALNRLKAIEKVKNYIKENFNYDPDNWAHWRNSFENKFFIGYHYMGNDLKGINFQVIKPGSPIGYLKTEKDCNKLIKEMKEELEIIYK